MGIFTSPKRRAMQAAQARLSQAQANLSRLRMFVPGVAAGLDSEGYRYAQRAIGVFMAIAGWPSLTPFLHQLGSIERHVASITNEDAGWRKDRAITTVATRQLLKAYTEFLTLTDVDDMQTIACMLMVWWWLSDLAEPQNAVVHLMRHFGGHPIKSDSAQAIEYHFRQLCGLFTPETDKVWKRAEREMSIYGNELLAE
jgi:hypothetical protein